MLTITVTIKCNNGTHSDTNKTFFLCSERERFSVTNELSVV